MSLSMNSSASFGSHLQHGHQQLSPGSIGSDGTVTSTVQVMQCFPNFYLFL